MTFVFTARDRALNPGTSAFLREILTKGAPRSVADIEKLMAQGRRGVAAPAPARKP